jgi:hypothetical protein
MPSGISVVVNVRKSEVRRWLFHQRSQTDVRIPGACRCHASYNHTYVPTWLESVSYHTISEARFILSRATLCFYLICVQQAWEEYNASRSFGSTENSGTPTLARLCVCVYHTHHANSSAGILRALQVPCIGLPCQEDKTVSKAFGTLVPCYISWCHLSVVSLAKRGLLNCHDCAVTPSV